MNAITAMMDRVRIELREIEHDMESVSPLSSLYKKLADRKVKVGQQLVNLEERRKAEAIV